MLILIISGLLLGTVVAYVYEHLPFRKIFKKDALIIRGYRLHHSLYGIFLILVTFMLDIDPSVAIIIISSGVGIIFQHFLTGGGFDFITKEKNR